MTHNLQHSSTNCSNLDPCVFQLLTTLECFVDNESLVHSRIWRLQSQTLKQ